MAPHHGQRSHNRLRHRAIEKCCPHCARTFAAATTNRDGGRTRDCYSTPLRSSPLAKVTILGRPFRFARSACVCPTKFGQHWKALRQWRWLESVYFSLRCQTPFQSFPGGFRRSNSIRSRRTRDGPSVCRICRHSRKAFSARSQFWARYIRWASL